MSHRSVVSEVSSLFSGKKRVHTSSCEKEELCGDAAFSFSHICLNTLHPGSLELFILFELYPMEM